ncbi:MAG: ABC transporter substrate-binding protein [Beijerinckiaceae bacterium]|nr:ABC transporter substrate-binding protein [Beijerinckiaceae bacterium]
MSVARLFFALGLCAAALLSRSGVSAADAPRRVVSANLCSDQLLLALADRKQIASLSPYARDHAMSHLAALAAPYDLNRGSGEDLIRLDADLVLIGPYDSRYTRALLAKRNLRFESLQPWSSLEEGKKQIRFLANMLGHGGRGEALIAEIERARARLAGLAARQGRAPSVLVLHRRGYVFHAGVTGELLAAAGFTNAAERIGLSGAGFVSLEAILTAKPDFLLVSDIIDGAEDQGQAFLQHPALERLYPASKRLVAPDRLTLCGGPSTPDLIDRLAAEIRAKVR